MSSFTLREKKAMEAHLFTPKIEVLIQRSQQEKSEYLTRTQIFEEIYKGGMPDICTNVSERNIYYKSYDIYNLGVSAARDTKELEYYYTEKELMQYSCESIIL